MRVLLGCSILSFTVMACAPVHSVDAGTGPRASLDAGGSCGTPALGQALTVGTYEVRVLAQVPGPPERGDNTWTVAVTEHGAQVTGAVVVARPFMPAHGHGTTPVQFLGVEGSPGNYALGPFNLFMPGSWEVRIGVNASDAGSPEVAFGACIQG